MPVIKLADILNIEDPTEYKAHCAIWNGENHPLDVFARDREEWHSWNSYKTQKNDFNRKYIFSLMDFYHEKNTLLFGGIYEVLSIDDKKNEYNIRLDDRASEFIGRLKINIKIPRTRNPRLKLERIYYDCIVAEILKEPYSGQSFCGYEDIDLPFKQIEIILKNQKQDWRAALQNIKGVYLITDTTNGRQYIGSAYGENGIWSRWDSYINTGHGKESIELKQLIKDKGLEYAKENFKFTLLEYRPTKVDDQVIIDREAFWKKVLLTGEFGYNKN